MTSVTTTKDCNIHLIKNLLVKGLEGHIIADLLFKMVVEMLDMMMPALAP